MLVWDSSYSVKVKEIDNQHKRLIDYINLLDASTRDDDPKEIISEIMKSLTVYTIEHFKTEEDYFSEFKYEKASEHIAEHQRLVKDLDDYIKQFESNDDFNSDHFMSFLKDWLIDHIMGTDKEYMHCFAENKLT